MVVILPQAAYDEWLVVTPESSLKFMRAFPADDLQAVAVAH